MRRLLSRSPTLFGILASRSTMLMGSGPPPIELGALGRAVAGQCAFFARGVRPREDPVLPRAEAAEDLAVAVLGARETQRGLHTGQRVGRQRNAFFERDADVVAPVHRVEQVGAETLFVGL